jgi:hypothetical protein
MVLLTVSQLARTYPEMDGRERNFMAEIQWKTVWRLAALVGVALVVTGAAAEYVDVATHFRFDFISDDYGVFGLALLLGVLLSFTGLIGWARHLDRPARMKMAGLVFAFPWVAVLVGYPIDGLNVHGAAPMVLMLVIPATILSIILLLMRSVRERKSS